MKLVIEKIDRKILAIGGIMAAFLIMPLYDGGNGWVAISFLFFLAFPVFYFSWHDNRTLLDKTLRTPANLIFILFLCSIAISIFFSADKFTSAIGLLVWLSIFIFFLSVQAPFSNKNRTSIAYSIVAISSLITLIGFYHLFSSIENFSHLRLESTFYQHNALGGYLLIPLVLSIALFLNSKSEIKTKIFGASSILLCSALVFTFSRGTWASFIASGVVLSFFFRKKMYSSLKIHIQKLLWLIGLSLLLSLVFFGLKSILAKDTNSVITLYGGETLSENTITVRLHYFRDALLVARHNPIFGAGFSHYGEAVKKYKDVPEYYTSHPHNIVLKYAAELGITGVLFFLFLIWFIFREILYRIRKSGESYKLLLFGGLTGLLAACFHNLVDIDWTYPANIFIFFVFAGTLLASSEGTSTSPDENKIKIPLFKLLATISFIPFVLSIPLSLSWYYFEKASVYTTLDDVDSVISYAERSTHFNPWNPAPYYTLELAYRHLAEINPEAIKRDEFATQALYYVNKAIRLKPEKPLLYSEQALLYKYLRNVPKEEGALKQAIRYTPADAIFEYRGLADLYIQEKRFDDVIDLLQPILPKYPISLWKNIYWINPDKDAYKISISDLYVMGGIALEEKHESARAKKAYESALLYNKNNGYAASRLKTF